MCYGFIHGIHYQWIKDGLCNQSKNIFRCTQCSRAIRSSGCTSVFKAKVLVIVEAYRFPEHNLSPKRNLFIVTDNQAVIKCRNDLKSLSDTLKVTLPWIPDHWHLAENR